VGTEAERQSKSPLPQPKRSTRNCTSWKTKVCQIARIILVTGSGL